MTLLARVSAFAAVAMALASAGVGANPYNTICLSIFGEAPDAGLMGQYGIASPRDPLVPASVVSLNTPVLRLENVSESGYELTRFVLQTGDDDRVFDWAAFETASDGVGWKQLSPPLPDNGGPGTQDEAFAPVGRIIEYEFSRFGVGGVFEFQTDIDPGIQDFRSVLFGGASPAVARCFFADGTVAETVLGHDYASDERMFQFRVIVEDATTVIPEPACLQMGALVGMSALGLLKTRARR